MQAAQNDLSESEPEAYMAFLLGAMGGLRRGEIDRLEWTAFDWQLESSTQTPSAVLSR